MEDDAARDLRLEELAALVAEEFPSCGNPLLSRAVWEFWRAEGIRPHAAVVDLWRTDVLPVLTAAENAIVSTIRGVLRDAPELSGRGEIWLREQLDTALEVMLENLIFPTSEATHQVWEENREAWLKEARTRYSVWYLESKLEQLQSVGDDHKRAGLVVTLLEEAAALTFDEHTGRRLHAFALPRDVIEPLLKYTLTSDTNLYGAEYLRELYTLRNTVEELPTEAFAKLDRFWSIVVIRGPEQKYWNRVLQRTYEQMHPTPASTSSCSTEIIDTSGEAELRVRSYLRRHGVYRQLRVEENESGYLVFQNPTPHDLPGHLPVHYVTQDGEIYRFPGDSPPEMMRSADPSNPGADPTNPLNQAWRLE